MTDVHYASLTSQGAQGIYRDGHPSRYQRRPTGLNFGEQTGTGVFPLVIAVPHLISLRMCRLSNVRLTLYPNHKVGQVIIVLDFLGGYNKPLLENLEEVGWLK